MTLLPVGQSPQSNPGLQALPHEALSRRILGLPRTTLTRDAPKRMSLAGAQHKMLAVLKGLDVYEPVGSTPPTNILKPDHTSRESYPASAFLEWLTMQLAAAAAAAAAAARLGVPAVALFRVPQAVYAIERFDRRLDPAECAPETGVAPPAVQRVHAIDACQLPNKSRVFKYGAALHAEHYPQQEGLLTQFNARAMKPVVQELDDLQEAATQAAPVNAHAAQATSQEKAQQLKIPRVLRHIVLPEMVPRILRSE